VVELVKEIARSNLDEASSWGLFLLWVLMQGLLWWLLLCGLFFFGDVLCCGSFGDQRTKEAFLMAFV